MTDASDLPAPTATAEILVDGRPFDPFAQPICEHALFHHQTEIAIARGADGTIVARQVQVRLQCASCGEPISFAVADDGRVGALSTDRRTLSAVLDL